MEALDTHEVRSKNFNFTCIPGLHGQVSVCEPISFWTYRRIINSSKSALDTKWSLVEQGTRALLTRSRERLIDFYDF